MKAWLRKPLVGILLVVVVFLGAIPVLNSFTATPTNLGIQDGRLAECPESPNCVSTQARDNDHRMQPIPFQCTAQAAMQSIQETLRDMRGFRIEATTDHYVHAVATTRWLRFKDDVEFLVDADERLIHFRSASRVGYSDLGANRKRMKRIVRELDTRLAEAARE